MNEVPGLSWGPQAKALASTLHDQPHSELAVTTGPPDSNTRYARRSSYKNNDRQTELSWLNRKEQRIKRGGGKGSHSFMVTVF